MKNGVNVKDQTGFVYFVRAGSDGPVKIGFTANVEKRISELQTGCPHKLVLLRSVERDDAREHESELHEKLAHLRIDNSEWFRWHPDLQATIEDTVPKQRVLIDDRPEIRTDASGYWSPTRFHSDPMVNAVLNVAAQLAVLANATNGLLYGLKYSKSEGMSLAESIEVAGKSVAAGIESLAGEIRDK